MGLIQSVLCTCTFCVERVLTWTCCAFLLMLLMFTFIALMVYGISVGYHYAQKELASFAMKTRQTTPPPVLRQGSEGPPPVVRLLAVNRSEIEQPPQPQLEVYRRQGPKEDVYMEKSSTPIVLLQTENPPTEPALAPHEKEIAKYLIGRFRRSRNITDAPTNTPSTNFYRSFAKKLLTNMSIT